MALRTCHATEFLQHHYFICFATVMAFNIAITFLLVE